MRKLLILSAVALALTACQKEVATAPDKPHTAAADPAVPTLPEDKPDTPSDEGTVTPVSAVDVSALPHAYNVTTDAVEAVAAIDDDLFETFPAIAKKVHAIAKQDFDTFVDAAKSDMAAGNSSRAYSYADDWSIEAVSGHLVSIRRNRDTYTGGAHGNYKSDAYLLRQQDGDGVAFKSFFIDPQSAFTADRGHIIDALADQKIKAGYAETGRDMLIGELSDALPLEVLMNAKTLLLSSDTPGKFGGYMLIFDPYEIGAYAEGQYEAIVPQAHFQSALKPEYQGLFSGEPALH